MGDAAGDTLEQGNLSEKGFGKLPSHIHPRGEQRNSILNVGLEDFIVFS